MRVCACDPVCACVMCVCVGRCVSVCMCVCVCVCVLVLRVLSWCVRACEFVVINMHCVMWGVSCGGGVEFPAADVCVRWRWLVWLRW